MPFEKGKSGNPGGRPKDKAGMAALARKHGIAAINRLVRELDNDDSSIAIKAANSLLDRGFGRPAQSLIHQGDEEGGPVRVERIKRVIADPGNTDR